MAEIRNISRYARMSIARFRNDVGGTIAIANESNPAVTKSIVRRGAVRALRRKTDPRADAFLVDRLAADRDPVVRVYAADALGTRTDERAREALRHGLADPDDRVFAASANSLVRAFNPLPKAELLAHVSGRSMAAKLAVARSVGKSEPSSDAIELLRTLADDETPRVRRAAIAEVEQLDPTLAAELAQRELPAAGRVDSATYKNIIDRDRVRRQVHRQD